ASRTCSSCAPRSKVNGPAIRRRRRNTSTCRITIGRCRASANEQNRSISLWPCRCWRSQPFRIAQPGLETKPHFHHLWGLRNGGSAFVTEVSIMQKWRNESFVDVVNLIFGAWLLAAPWLYGFASGAAGWNAWIMGALIALVAIAALAAFAEWE